MEKFDITIEKIKEDSMKVNIKKDDNYLFSYPHFLDYFRNNPISESTLIIGINFTYGWMPTIFNFQSFNLIPVIEILNRVKSGNSLKIDELDVLKNCFNNSIIGTSKLLHFINPELYPIIDSNVYRYLTKKRPHFYSVNNSSFYFQYINFCKRMTEMAEFESIHEIVNSKIRNEVTKNVSKMRAIELIMFYTGKSESK
jgi:hypothetical protein